MVMWVCWAGHILCSMLTWDQLFGETVFYVACERLQQSDLSDILEVVMNCQSCNTRIDYRFVTKCDHCDTEIGPASVSTMDPLPDVSLAAPVERRINGTRRAVNLIYVLLTSVAGMISGAVVIYFAGAFAYLAIFGHGDGNSSHDCARGNAIAMMLILAGAFLGTIAGTAFAVKNPMCKGAQ
jgi:hypothetical protein